MSAPFTYTNDIPATANNPSADQPPMKTNTNSNSAIWNVDHYGMNNNFGGYHNVIRQPSYVPIAPATKPPLIGTPPNIGQTYTKDINAGADNQLFFESAAGVEYNLCSVPQSQSGSIPLIVGTPVTVMSNIPDNCIGIISVVFGSGKTLTQSFFSVLGTIYYPPNYSPGGIIVSYSLSGNNLQAVTNLGFTYTFKAIYWQV